MESSYLAPSFFSNVQVDCFHQYTGKTAIIKRSDGTVNDNANDTAIYNFFKYAENKQQNKNYKIKHFHPKNLQGLLAIGHDLALRNNQPEKAKKFKDKFEKLQKNESLLPLPSNFAFDINLEKKKENTYDTTTIFKAVMIGVGVLFFSMAYAYFDIQKHKSNLVQIPVKSDAGIDYLCTVSKSDLKDLGSLMVRLKSQLHEGLSGTASVRMADGSTQQVPWTYELPKNCIRA